MKKNYKYFAVFGSNNFGVYDDYSLAMQDVKLVAHGNIKGFGDYYGAMEYALEQYIWMHVICTGKVAPLFNKDGTITINTLVFKYLYRLVD